MSSCWAIGCNHNSAREPCEFFRFPPNRELSERWMVLLRGYGGKPPKGVRVCSCHYRDGQKENGPEIPAYYKRIYSPMPEEMRTRKRKLSEMEWECKPSTSRSRSPHQIEKQKTKNSLELETQPSTSKSTVDDSKPTTSSPSHIRLRGIEIPSFIVCSKCLKIFYESKEFSQHRHID